MESTRARRPARLAIRHGALIAALMTLWGCGGGDEAPAQFPQRPIKIIVYTGPGGALDTTARKLAEVAARYTDATFVAENKPGAGGFVALRSLLEAPADGYTLFAATKSLVAKMVATRNDGLLDALDWRAMVMADPQCVIVNQASKIPDWSTLLADAKASQEQQIWVGPAAGGLDHITAQKIWDRAGIDGRWVPYKSGGMATTVLMGQQGAAYLGNPRDVLGKPSLKVAALCAPQRAAAFPDAPTFKELGVEGLDGEIMWRGFALRQGAPEAAAAWYQDLFEKISADEAWRAYWEKSGIDATYRGPEALAATVAEDRAALAGHLAKMGLLEPPGERPLLDKLLEIQRGLPLATLLLALALAFTLWRLSGHRLRPDTALLPLLLILGAALFIAMTLTFPPSEGVGAAFIPRLWAVGLLILGGVLLVKAWRGQQPPAPSGDLAIVGVIIGAAALYVILVPLISYIGASILFLALAPRLLGHRAGLISAAAVALTWALFVLVVFQMMMKVPLPGGAWL